MKNTERSPVSKALKALIWLVQNPAPDVGVRDLAAGLGVVPSSAHRILGSLCEDGFVKQNKSNGRYALGLETFRLAHLIVARAPWRTAALTHMRKLVDRCNETALLGVYDAHRQQMVFAAAVESGHQLRYAIDLHTWMPVYAGASGLAILAFLGDDEIASVIERSRLSALTDATITDASRLRAALTVVRQQGYAITHGHRVPGAVGLAAPVFGSDGRVIGDVCLTVPEQRFDKRGVAKLTKMLLACTGGITADIRRQHGNTSARAA